MGKESMLDIKSSENDKFIIRLQNFGLVINESKQKKIERIPIEAVENFIDKTINHLHTINETLLQKDEEINSLKCQIDKLLDTINNKLIKG